MSIAGGRFGRHSATMALAVLAVLVAFILGRDVLHEAAKRTVSRATYDRKALEALASSRSADMTTSEKPVHTDGSGLADSVPAGVSGVVLTSKREPIKGATVAIVLRSAETDPPGVVDRQAVLESTRTEANGAFRLHPHGQIDVKLHVVADGYRAAWIDVVEGNRNGMEILLESGGAIRGQVVAKSLGPIAGVVVVAAGRGFPKAPISTDSAAFLSPGIEGAIARTGNDGSFCLDGLAPGVYTVEACAPGLIRDRPQDPAIQARPGDKVTLTVDPSLVGSFYLIDAETKEAITSYAMVNVETDWWTLGFTNLGSGELWTPSGTWTSRPSGRGVVGFNFIMVSPSWPIVGEHSVLVSAKAHGYRNLERESIPAQIPGGAKAPEVTPVQMVPEEHTGTVRAQFLSADGVPIRGLRVTMRLADGNGKWVCNQECALDAEGRASFRMREGQYVEYCERGTTAVWDNEPLTVGVGGASNWSLKLRQCYLRFRFRTKGGCPIVPFPCARIAHCAGDGPVALRIQGVERDASVVLARRSEMSFEGQRKAVIPDYFLGGDVGVVGPVEPGKRSFEVLCPGYQLLALTTTLEPGTVKDIVLSMEENRDGAVPDQRIDER